MKFKELVSKIKKGRLEEIYTHTFDLNPKIVPYIGYHIFGESYKRGNFLSSLREVYEEMGYKSGKRELPDHIAVILDFLSRSDLRDKRARDLAEEGLMKVLTKISRENVKSENPYLSLLEALRQYLQEKLEEKR